MPYKNKEDQREYMKNYARKNREKLREIENRYYKNKKSRSQNNGVCKDPLIKTCKRCEEEQPHDWMKDTYRNAGGRYKHVCKYCIRKEKRRNYAKSRETGSVAFHRRENLKKKCVQYLGGKCLDCGLEDECPVIYDFHHRDPKTKIKNIGNLLQGRNNLNMSKKLIEELDKCDLLCSNCHRRRHYMDKSANVGRPIMDTQRSRIFLDRIGSVDGFRSD